MAAARRRAYIVRMRERNGVELGMRVRDLDGTPLGRVTKVYDEGFAVRKGLPFLFRRDHVALYGEVRGIRDGELVLARSRRGIFDLAEGAVPSSWRIPVPPEFPSIATPSEARDVFEAIARGAISTAGAPSPGPRGGREVAPLRPGEERTHVATRGEPVPRSVPGAAVDRR